MKHRKISASSHSVVIFFAFCLLFLQKTECAKDEDQDALAPVYEHDVMEEHLCDEPPPPLNGELICGKHKKNANRYVCKASCHDNYQFPNGKTKGRHTCDLTSGKWTPEYTFPDCMHICVPPCGNGGECLEDNRCICTPGYRGDRCQYGLDLCDPNKDLVSADWSCNHTFEQSLCVMNCPQGTRYESPPADIYYCNLDGTWTPSFAPRCIPINVIEAPGPHGMFPMSTGQMVSSSRPNSGVCAVWGASHYRTFDGGIYSFQGPCTYLLSKDCEQNTFAIHIQNGELCESVSSCATTLAIYIGSELYLLSNDDNGDPVVHKGGTKHIIPAAVDGLLFQMLSDYVTVSSSLGFRLKWNRKNTVLLKANSQLQNRTCGLCGKFDGSALNDFETSDGSLTDSVDGFVNSWTMEDLGEKCEKKAVVKDSCSENKERITESEGLCRVIFDEKFSSCHELVDPKAYYEVCKMDQCSCPFETCYCSTLAEYFRECTRLGGKLHSGWRSSELCPLACPEGMIYSDCGTSCPKTCKNTVYDCEDSHCLDGCHCPDDKVLHDGRCVDKQDCPCMHNGKEHQTGKRILVDCNACECNAGKWDCTKEKCEARCTSAGDPHYTTFDGLNYEFLGSCPYYLVYNDNFTIVQESGPCPASSGSEPATEGMFCTNSITITYLGESLFVQPGIKVSFNGKDATLPISEAGISASMPTDMFMKVHLANGVSVLWDGHNRIYIDAPPSLFGQTAGLCGTFNRNQNDDFLTPTKDIEADVSEFAARWQASDSCHKRARRESSNVPCESQPQKLEDAVMLCSTLKLSMFEACHTELDPESYYKSCVSDLCMCTQDLRNCLCPILADYSLSCSRKGIVLNWMDEITGCKYDCTGGQVYQECGNPCRSSCAAIATSENCKEQCVQGCTCEKGMTLNNEGFCVSVDQCPCIYESKEYLPASVTVQGSNICTCQGARWQCRPGSLSELVVLNKNIMIDDDTSKKCSAENNEEFTQCREECPRTCQNMHLPPTCKTEECKPGCKCMDGFIFDSEKNKCVEEKECGCVHGRRRYRSGETIKQSCNLCTCLDGAWICTEKLCPGVCSVWGESHFKTFDGKIFDFHGECEYILSKGKMKGASYSLTVQNAPCGTSGITCSKSFTLDLGPAISNRGDIDEIIAEAEKLTLSKDEPLPKTTYSSRFVVLEAGLFVMVYTDIGISLQWDRGTRIYVTAEPKWRERVNGLCGNFNDDQTDDFFTPSGGIPEANAYIFAESWKVNEFCPPTQTVEDSCEIHPQRKSWAQQKCGILKSETFSGCHSEVAMEPYYERCIFDSCACDMGGDCECLCTAIAAYAQECNMHGVSIKWRSQELCPIQCEECATYDSCLPSCPKKTCENDFLYGKIELACGEDFCVEGCNPKPCPEGQIYNNGREYKCIPQAECVVPCMQLNGIVYNEGDRITDVQVVDACQSCHCLRGTIDCKGQRCVDTEPIRPCMETGWTPWLNTPPIVGGDFEVLTNPRMKATLDNYCGIANMTNIECRDAETKQPYGEVGQRVSCSLPSGLSCNDQEQGDSICKDYEIRVYCDCGPIPTTAAIPATVPETLPPVCVHTGWTPWMSRHWPSEEGEFETLDMLRINHYFCAGEEIENIECRATGTDQYVSEEDKNVICNKKLGLVCKGPECPDYEVRIFCRCEAEITTPAVPACVTGWTEFFNTDNPVTSDIGDDESLERIRENHKFCEGGTLEDVECKALINGVMTDYKELSEMEKFGLKCSKNAGFICNKYTRTEKCEDFSVRFYCACEPIPETRPPLTTIVTTTTTKTPVPITPVPVECGWTPWLNTDSPDMDEGDIEDLAKIQALYKTCGGKDFIDIECRMSRTLHKYSESLQKNLVCDTQQGFLCYNKDQIGGSKCYDYEVRLLCMYSWCYPPTTTLQPTENPCPDGLVYDLCAFHCDQLCLSLAYKMSEECGQTTEGCIPGCRPATGCEPPMMWRDYRTCVSKEECTCTIQDESGNVINIAPNQVTVNGCEKCQCIENHLECHSIPGCGVTMTVQNQPGTTTPIPTTPTPTTPEPVNITQEDCWTQWINIDTPSGGGDLEVPTKIRKRYIFCINPIKIECRTAGSHQKPFDVGQSVTCEIDDGLICWNKENKLVGCYDYEIRFFCPCPTQAPPTTTTTTPIPTLEPGPCKYGWTDWFNTHEPDGRGDYETVQSARISNSFCSSDMITRIECKQVGKPSGQLQRGVHCELDVGLKCNPESMSVGEECGDYEVRFFCDCPIIIPYTFEPVPPAETTPPVYRSCAYWSDWINEHHPISGAGDTKKGGIKGGGKYTGDSEKALPVKLQREYKFCTEGIIDDIECREADTDLDYTQTGDEKLKCNVKAGFRCRGQDQKNHICKDYKIRYFCSCVETSTTTVLIKPTTPEIYIPPCTSFYDVVDGPQPLDDTRLKASTSKDALSGPQSARLSSKAGNNSAGAWIAANTDKVQYIEVDLGDVQPVYGVVTKGRNGHNEYVKSYKVLYSRDGNAYTYVKSPSIFAGNYDSDSNVTHVFDNPFEARYVRIQPDNFHGDIAMRVGILGCGEGKEFPIVTTTMIPPCIDEMGMENRFIVDEWITTSTNINPSSDGRYARLNTNQTENHSGGWVAGVLDGYQFIQVEVCESGPRDLTGVTIQGRDKVPHWVTSFAVSYSQDGITWNKISDENGVKIFSGNHDSSTAVNVYFPQVIRARFIRIHPVTWEQWIALRLEILGCFKLCERVKPFAHTTPAPATPPVSCIEPMGLENHQLPDALISVSSSRGPNSGASRIRLHTHKEVELTGGWIAAADDYMPKVYIDFYDERNITGIITQGLEDADLWTVTYKVQYSLDNRTWSFAKDMDTGDLTFSGNYDRNSEVTHLFTEMINTRFLKIIIVDYHDDPALRLEILGCFIPYTVHTPTPPVFTTTEMCVRISPWISLSDPASSVIGDVEPIDKIIAAYGVCNNPFDIECRTVVTGKDYNSVGQDVTCDLTHGLLCKNEKQSSYQCYNYEVRIKCWTCAVETTTLPLPLEMCPEVPDTLKENCPISCRDGSACDGYACVNWIDCPCFKNGKRFEPSNAVITEDCQRCDCIIGGHSMCEPIVCPDCLPGQKPEMDSSCHCGCVGCAEGTKLCPTSGECIKEELWCDGVVDCPDDETGCPKTTKTTTVAPTTTTLAPTTTEIVTCSTDLLQDTDSCELLANMFDTFDGLTYQYDICNHVLMEEATSGLYSVSVHKTCPSEGLNSCNRYLVIEVDGVVIKLGPGIEDVTVQDNRVSVANLWLVSKRFRDFELKKRGSTLVFSSKKYNFDVFWDTLEDVKIVVSKCLVRQVVGLCGLYNKEMNDDLTMPNGNLASGSTEFGNSWSIGSLEKCKPPSCPPYYMKTAIEVCNELRGEPFNSSCYEYMKVDARVESCTVYMCECLQRSLDAGGQPSKDVLYDFFDVGSCKCQAYESYVEACENARQGPIQEWRIRHDCTPECPEGMEWQDCGAGCELTCDNYHQRDELCTLDCVPGCYCPPGLVRHHNRCVKPRMCQDCVCRGHGDPNYITFDGRYYAFQGNCTYILAQHLTSDDEAMNFRVLAANVECPEEPHTSCTQGLTIYWKSHVIEKFKNKPVYFDQMSISAEDSPLEHDGISITYVPNKSTLIHIKEINLAVRYFDQMYGFNIELPAFYYYNKTEGLCGVCNFIQSDDLYHRDGYLTEDIEDFAYSWLEEHQTRKNCELPRVFEQPRNEVPPGICNFTTSPCEIFLDPTLYSASCQNDVSYSRIPEVSMCRSKFQYAQQCCERGVSLVEWLQMSGCESSCPEGMLYECTSACQKTCDNYKTYREDDCGLMPLYTCVCPEGEVLKLGKCVKTEKCEVCDAQGHIPGDVWQVGPCETCECMPDLRTSCTVIECPLPPMCNSHETLQVLNNSANGCCDTYQCMPLADVTCPELPTEKCPPGQAYIKDTVDGCPMPHCECIPSLCPPVVIPLQLEEGENYTIALKDCCEVVEVVCHPETCAPPPYCNLGFKLSSYQGKCCEMYTCVPKHNVCVYQHKYDVVDGMQVDLAIGDYYEKEYEPGSTWHDGLCRECACVDLGGQFAYSCREEKCPDPNEFPDAEKYYREKIHLPGSCCPKYTRVACVVDGVKYAIDEVWPSHDGNPCKSYRCVTDKRGEATRLEMTTMCDRNCPDYAEYVEASPESGKCCGFCKPVACEENGIIYQDGQTWVSTVKPCFTAECSVKANGTQITYRGESCPIMTDNCPPENVKTDPKGCCTYCKKPTENCNAVEVPLYETRGFMQYVDPVRGFCINDQVIHGLTKCGGQCSSKSQYSDLLGDFQSVCNCCLPKESKNINVTLECADGSTVEKVYMQPITCQCLSCSGNSRNLESMNEVALFKK